MEAAVSHPRNGIRLQLHTKIYSFRFSISLYYCTKSIFPVLWWFDSRPSFPLHVSASITPFPQFLFMLFLSQLLELCLSRNVAASTVSASCSLLHLFSHMFFPSDFIGDLAASRTPAVMFAIFLGNVPQSHSISLPCISSSYTPSAGSPMSGDLFLACSLVPSNAPVLVLLCIPSSHLSIFVPFVEA